MKVEQIYTGCLAQGAYYIESEGEVAIIDPLRETEPYIKMVEDSGAKVKYIFETHFHADFVSGHVDLAQKTGAQIVYGPEAKTQYAIHNAKDGETFQVGKATIKALHTPGHTLESTCYLLIDEAGKQQAIFTGDTLFIGDVGRPDLAIKSDLTQEDLAGMLYDSLRSKILPLDDDITVYPGHGAGSACGKNMSKETTDLLGNQKQSNYALKSDMTREQFIKELTTGIMPAPQYFAKNARLNQMGYDSIDLVMQRGMQALSPEAFSQKMAEGTLVLDTRDPQVFAKSHLPGAINIGLNGMFAVWVGTLIEDLHQPILVVSEVGCEEETVLRLARVGYDNTIGYLEGGVEAWQKAGKETQELRSINAQTFAQEVAENGYTILDVRKPSEYDSEHLEAAQTFPLDFINENLYDLDKSKPYYIHCAGGYRSMIAASIMQKHGFSNLTDVAGGFKAIAETELPKTAFVCPSTL